jgi:hypothetical protein
MNPTEIVIKSTPPALLSAWSVWGFTLNEVAAIAGIIYSLLMIYFLLVDRFAKWKKERDELSK